MMIKMAKESPEAIADRIVNWFPNGAFTYDTWTKLRRDIASAIKSERDSQLVENVTHTVKDRLEGKAYALRAIKLAAAALDERDLVALELQETYQWLQCAIDVLEGRVPRLATLPEITS